MSVNVPFEQVLAVLSTDPKPMATPVASHRLRRRVWECPADGVSGASVPGRGLQLGAPTASVNWLLYRE